MTTSPDESIGIFLQATPLTQMSQEMCLSRRARPPHRRLHKDKKGSVRMSFLKRVECCSTPARHAASAY